MNIRYITPLFFLVPVLFLYGFTLTGVGFVSDDFTLIKMAETHDFFSAMEPHHHSLLINVLFKGVAAGFIGPNTFHVLALIFHVMNCLLLLYFLDSCLHIGRNKALFVCIFFAVNLPGREALIWCCAVPYVVVTTFILLSMVIYGDALNKIPRRSTLTTTLLLSFLQFAAFMVWDWAVLIFPVLFLMACLLPNERTLKEKLRLLIVPGCVWGGIFIARQLFGMTNGYQINGFSEIIKILLSAPFLGLFPFLPKYFYTSSFGIMAAVVCFTGFVWTAMRNRTILFFFAFFLLSQLPQAVFGHPQSRYFYFPVFALYASIAILFPTRFAFSKFAIPSFILFMLTGFSYMTFNRILSWQEASQIINRLSGEIQHAMSVHKQIYLVEFPDSYGSEETIWRPYLWRSGLEIFGKGLIKNKEPEEIFPVYTISSSDEKKPYSLIRIK